ncbi:hypothetical protein LZ30DRAFT_71106 [Colletotrichum cereale]|nr:hypothetical protein LZ30DRAFT_71106 [Colletotrichum cereale]
MMRILLCNRHRGTGEKPYMGECLIRPARLKIPPPRPGARALLPRIRRHGAIWDWTGRPSAVRFHGTVFPSRNLLFVLCIRHDTYTVFSTCTGVWLCTYATLRGTASAMNLSAVVRGLLGLEWDGKLGKRLLSTRPSASSSGIPDGTGRLGKGSQHESPATLAPKRQRLRLAVLARQDVPQRGGEERGGGGCQQPQIEALTAPEGTDCASG